MDERTQDKPQTSSQSTTATVRNQLTVNCPEPYRTKVKVLPPLPCPSSSAIMVCHAGVNRGVEGYVLYPIISTALVVYPCRFCLSGQLRPSGLCGPAPARHSKALPGRNAFLHESDGSIRSSSVQFFFVSLSLVAFRMPLLNNSRGTNSLRNMEKGGGLLRQKRCCEGITRANK